MEANGQPLKTFDRIQHFKSLPKALNKLDYKFGKRQCPKGRRKKKFPILGRDLNTSIKIKDISMSENPFYRSSGRIFDLHHRIAIGKGREERKSNIHDELCCHLCSFSPSCSKYSSCLRKEKYKQ